MSGLGFGSFEQSHKVINLYFIIIVPSKKNFWKSVFFYQKLMNKIIKKYLMDPWSRK